MSEDNGLITHTTTSPHQENQTATENKAMVSTSLDLILGTLKGNSYNLILVLCKITLDPRPVLPLFETAGPASFLHLRKKSLSLAYLSRAHLCNTATN